MGNLMKKSKKSERVQSTGPPAPPKRARGIPSSTNATAEPSPPAQMRSSAREAASRDQQPYYNERRRN